MMETNIGRLDQLLRITAFIVGTVIYFNELLPGFAGLLVGLVSIYCFVTALTRYSPVWEMLGISTEKTFHRILPPV